ncbi:MAG: FG-GAP-like repeat-containing protein [Candidatus Cloacimonetes bacterium]|nr:FG-GAP-like repeat-containing protein [Candidatus Cloacimonadota bacterium]
MTKSRVLLLCLLLMLAGLLSSTPNHLDVMTYMSGEFNGCEFGESLASLDFNGDGYMDLVVSSGSWNPDQVFADQNRWGKLYFYWGGPDFDNVADLVIPGAYNWHMGQHANVFNAGDVNGDGEEDLIMYQRTEYYDTQVAIYFGRTNPQTTPDILLVYPYSEVVDGLLFIPLGDVNGDGKDDISLTVHYSDGNKIVEIWDDCTEDPVPFASTQNGQRLTRLCGIGDINSDGYDDCILHMPINPMGETHDRLVLYYGSPTFPVTDSLVICEDSNQIIKSWSCPLGDVNGDGYDDFVSWGGVNSYSQPMWLGGEDITATWSLELSGVFNYLSHQLSEVGTGYPFIHGDLNGDGYQDVLSFKSNAGFYDGYTYLWMGGANMNASMDYLRLGMEGYYAMNYGWSKATGDFNADGYCDVAVGAPWWASNDHNETGRVYILAGSPDLHETTTANEDETMPAPNNDDWQTGIYPNPHAATQGSLNIQFQGAGYQKANSLKLEIYNLRGQKLLSTSVPNSKLQEGEFTLETGSREKGVYILRVSQDGKPLTTQKFTLF